MNTFEPTSLEVNSVKSKLRVEFGETMQELFVPRLDPVFLLWADESMLSDELAFVGGFPNVKFDWEAFANLLESPEFAHLNADQIETDDSIVLRWANLDVEIIDFDGQESGSAIRIAFHDGNEDMPEVSDLHTRQDVYDIVYDLVRVVNQTNPVPRIDDAAHRQDLMGI